MVDIVTAAGSYFGPRSAQRAVASAARDAWYAVASIDLANVTHEDMVSAVEDLTRIGSKASSSSSLGTTPRLTLPAPAQVNSLTISRTPMAVGVDQVAGTTAAVEHLVDLGHRRIGHVAGPADWAEAQARAEGWRTAMSHAGCPSPNRCGVTGAQSQDRRPAR